MKQSVNYLKTRRQHNRVCLLYEISKNHFISDNKLSVLKYIGKMKEIGMLLQYNDLQMFIYEKRILMRSVKKFIIEITKRAYIMDSLENTLKKEI